jgi:hypothetical protein
MKSRTVRFELLMTPAEKKRWQRLAARDGESFAAWWRRLARQAESDSFETRERAMRSMPDVRP